MAKNVKKCKIKKKKKIAVIVFCIQKLRVKTKFKCKNIKISQKILICKIFHLQYCYLKYLLNTL